MVKISESDIVKIITDSGDKIFKDQNFCWHPIHELNAGYGIADIVFYKLDEDKFNERVDNGLNQPILSKEAIKTVIALKESGQPISITYLTKQLGISDQRMKHQVLKFLKENGYIEDIDGYCSLKHKYEFTLSESVAIEAKISDWKRGLYQAYRYKWFSQESYLALFYKHIKPALKNRALFEELNIGLISVDEKSVEVLFKPTKQDPKSEDKLILTNEQIFNFHLKKLAQVSL